MVWRTPAKKIPSLSGVIVVSRCVQINCPCVIVPMHEWKVPLKYWGMLAYPSGPLGLGQEADTMVWGGTYEMAGTKIYKHTNTEAMQKFKGRSTDLLILYLR